MKQLYTTLNPMLWITAMLVVHSHVVSSSDPAQFSKIPQEMKPKNISSSDVGVTLVGKLNSSESVSPNEIPQGMKQKIMANSDVGLTMVDNVSQKISNNLKIFQSVILTADITAIILIMAAATEIAPFMEVVSLTFTVGGLLYSVLSGKQTNEKLDMLNDKLDDISKEIYSLREELKASIEFNDWLVHLADYEANIRAGEEFLNTTLDELKKENDTKKKMKLANEFINVFERNRIEESAHEIYRLTGEPPTQTSQNLFDLFVKEKGCDIVELSRLMMTLRDMMTSAAKQSLVYYFFKDGNENRVGKSMTKYQLYLYDIRDYYDNQAWHCFINSIENAKTDVYKTIDENNVDTSLLSSLIYEKLSSLEPWYSWSVAQFEPNQAPSVTVHPSLSTHSVHFKAEGENYFIIKEYSSLKRNIMVVWQDSKDIFRSCDDISVSHTKVYFKPCEGCSSNSFVKSDNMINEHMCADYLKDIVKKTAHNQDFKPKRVLKNLEKHPVSFVVAEIGSHDDACISNPCLNNGICKPIHYTNSRLCMCKPFYEGVDCEVDVGTSLADNVTAILAKLREHFGILTGIPDVIDIYFQINDLATDIKNMQNSLQHYSEYENLITLYGNSIKEAEYISNYHSDFQMGKLVLQNFGKILDKFNFDSILLDFGQMITGEAILVEDDFLTSKKKSLSQDLRACTKAYSNAVSSLMRNLVTLDQVVVESMIWHARWKINNTPGISMKESLLGDVKQTYKYAIERQKLYYDNWNDKSCPDLNIANGKIVGINETIHCDKGLSYEGLYVNVQCMTCTIKTDNHYNVTCKKAENGTLEWSGIPQCELGEVWGNWTAWTRCSATCDNGTQIHFKRSNIGNVINETRHCFSGVKCCMQSNGAHICPTGVCIWPDKLCNGIDDCGDNEDETNCPYLSVGDKVALKSSCGMWLDCWKGDKGHKCFGTTCGGSSWGTSGWGDCSGHIFDHIAAENRGTGQAIRHGDRVALRYTHGDGYWLTCQNTDYCETHNCPGSTFEDNEFSSCSGEVYWILSDARKGDCDFKNSPGCIGDPIQPLDTIYLLHDAGGTGQWVSGDDGHTRLRTCDVRNNIDGCSCEKWEIFTK